MTSLVPRFPSYDSAQVHTTTYDLHLRRTVQKLQFLDRPRPTASNTETKASHSHIGPSIQQPSIAISTPFPRPWANSSQRTNRPVEHEPAKPSGNRLAIEITNPVSFPSSPSPPSDSDTLGMLSSPTHSFGVGARSTTHHTHTIWRTLGQS